VQEDGVTGLEGRVGAGCSVPAILANKRSINVVKHVCPDLANVCWYVSG
jgi:hypothetical protein